MVALLVLLTILTFLVIDGVVLSLKARKGHATALMEQNMVFAQDGGEPIEDVQEAKPTDDPEELSGPK